MRRGDVKRKNRALDNLFRKVGVFVLFIVSIYLIFTSEGSITGAAIGATSSSSFRIFLGFIGLIFAFILMRYKKKFDKEFN